VVGDDGERLAKRHGAVTIRDLEAEGWKPSEVVAALARSLGLAAPGESVTADRLVDRFDAAALPKAPVSLDDLQRSTS
jgi:glutamyl-tRNA synthetase